MRHVCGIGVAGAMQVNQLYIGRMLPEENGSLRSAPAEEWAAGSEICISSALICPDSRSSVRRTAATGIISAHPCSSRGCLSGSSVTNFLVSAIEHLLNSADGNLRLLAAVFRQGSGSVYGRMFSDAFSWIVIAGGGRQVYLVGCLYD